MYGEITEGLVKDFRETLLEGKVYELSRF